MTLAAAVRMERSHACKEIAWIISGSGLRCWMRDFSSSEADVGGIVGAFLAFNRVWKDFWAECYMKESTFTTISPRWLPVPILPLLKLTHHLPTHPTPTSYTTACFLDPSPSLPAFSLFLSSLLGCIILIFFFFLLCLISWSWYY